MSEYIKKEDVLKLIDTGCLISNSNYNKEIKLINELPSADVEPIRHGYWDEDMECSICGCLAPVSHVTGEEYAYDYCPNCGAKMDGEEQKRNIFLDESIDETAGYGEEQERE